MLSANNCLSRLWKTFSAKSGSPTRWEVCPLVQWGRGREFATQWQLRAFYTQAQARPCWLHHANKPTHPPPIPPPSPPLSNSFSSFKPISQGHCRKVTSQDEILMADILVISVEGIGTKITIGWIVYTSTKPNSEVLMHVYVYSLSAIEHPTPRPEHVPWTINE